MPGFYRGTNVTLLGKQKPFLLADALCNETLQTLFIDVSIDMSYLSLINPYGLTVRRMVPLGLQIDSAGLDGLVISKKPKNIR